MFIGPARFFSRTTRSIDFPGSYAAVWGSSLSLGGYSFHRCLGARNFWLSILHTATIASSRLSGIHSLLGVFHRMNFSVRWGISCWLLLDPYLWRGDYLRTISWLSFHFQAILQGSSGCYWKFRWEDEVTWFWRDDCPKTTRWTSNPCWSCCYSGWKLTSRVLGKKPDEHPLRLKPSPAAPFGYWVIRYRAGILGSWYLFDLWYLEYLFFWTIDSRTFWAANRFVFWWSTDIFDWRHSDPWISYFLFSNQLPSC